MRGGYKTVYAAISYPQHNIKTCNDMNIVLIQNKGSWC